MSLLIKALEQAAKDRDNAKPRSQRTSAPTATPSLELTIEPAPPSRSIPDLDPAPAARSKPDRDVAPALRSIPDLDPAPAPRASPVPVPSHSPAPSHPAPSLEASATPRPAPKSGPVPATPRSPSSPAAPRPNPTLSVDTAAASRLAAKSSASMANIDAQHQRARAATVMQASATSGSAVWSYLTGNPIVMISAVAGLAALGFGVYVYLQIAQPALFARAPATRPPGQTSSPSLSPPQAVNAGAPSGAAGPYPNAAAGNAASAAHSTVENSLSASAVPPSVAASVGPSSSEASRLTGPLSNNGVVPAAAVIAAPATADMPRESAPIRDLAPTRTADSRREQGSASPPAGRSAAPQSSEPARTREAITITPAQQPRLNPALSQAYSALQAGNLEQSGKLYAKVAQGEPLNIDALLGMAYIAAQENRTDDAVKLYVRILELNPRHASAQAALIGLIGRADPLSAETRVKQLIAQEPSPFLHFVLGNLYADQSQWAQAQQSYFQAHHLEPDNPDYAYNLAIALDHLSQSRLALGFYRRAEQLAKAQARANFNLLHARERITALSSKLE